MGPFAAAPPLGALRLICCNWASNPGPEEYPNHSVVILLDVWGIYFWYPSWSEEFDYDPYDVEIGSRTIEILRFPWPEVQGSAEGVLLYGALLTPGFSDILGNWDTVSFGWN